MQRYIFILNKQFTLIEFFLIEVSQVYLLALAVDKIRVNKGI